MNCTGQTTSKTKRTRSSATAEIARDAAIQVTQDSKLSLVYKILTLNSPTRYIHTPPVFQVELGKDGWDLVDMVWCHGAQNIGLFHHKLKSALKCTV